MLATACIKCITLFAGMMGAIKTEVELEDMCPRRCVPNGNDLGDSEQCLDDSRNCRGRANRFGVSPHLESYHRPAPPP